MEFQNYLLEQRKSIATINGYMQDIRQFVEYLTNHHKQINKLHNQDIEDYKNYLLYDEQLKVKTVNRKLVSINQFLTFNNVAVTIRQEKVQMQNFLSNLLTNEDVQKMINTTYKINDVRARTIINTLYYTGMRVSEMLQLTIYDINQPRINIKGKGSKFRTVFIPHKLLNTWAEYIPVRINKSDKLFTGERGAINRVTVDTILKKIARLSNVSLDKAHAHNFRHLYCKNLIKNDIDISTVADLCGHSSINTTRLYTRLSENELMNIINEL